MAKQSTVATQRRQTPTPSRAATRRAPAGRRGPDRAASNVTFGIPWKRQNVIGLGIGVLVVVVGYLLMSTANGVDPANNDGIWNNQNAVTYAPILLAIGYCVIIPFFIFKRFGGEAPGTQADNAA